MRQEAIAVVDFGGQYTHLIARRVRELGVYSRIVQPDRFDPAQAPDVVGVILSGSPASVSAANAHQAAFDVPHSPVPVLGLCYGHQLIAAACGGRVAADGRREYGITGIECRSDAALFAGLEARQDVWMSHGDHVERLPPGFRAVARSQSVEVAAFESADRRVFGLQFHPEVVHTRNGRAMLANFLSLCTPRREWRPETQRQEIVARIRREAAGRKLFLLVSGGVDSLVALALCLEAVGPRQVAGLHVDTGFMRRRESEEVAAHLASLGFHDLHVEDAGELFFQSLRGVVDPEEKRRIIGRLFVEVLRRALPCTGIGADWMLVQGTIYPDRIESGATGRSARIKTHHNRVEEIAQLIREGRVLEPLDDLYKDEVREVGRALGLPDALVQRHPFPGPGLAIRILCSDGREAGWGDEVSRGEGEPCLSDADLLPGHEAAARRIAAGHGFACRILPVRSVGVQGDARTYRNPAALWRKGGGAAQWAAVEACAVAITNQVAGVNRVVLSMSDLDQRPLALRPTFLDAQTAGRLREIDAVVRKRLGGCPEIWQVPVVLLPLYDPQGRPAFVVRPVTSTDAMTADFYRMPEDLLGSLVEDTAILPFAGPLLYDVSSKPPATIEWE